MNPHRPLLLALLGPVAGLSLQASAPLLAPPAPDESFRGLFAEVQRAGLFKDQKTFPDCEPKERPFQIMADYWRLKRNAAPVDLKAFVAGHFREPTAAKPPETKAATLEAHIAELWPLLTRRPDIPVDGSSLLPLPKAYVVPGGRFREVYYWDSYFTMLGLREAGRMDLVESMVDNFAHELATYGLIPNGNRSYYLSRSQPPFFAAMLQLLTERDGERTLLRYLPALEQEHAYWNDESFSTRHNVRLPDGAIVSRYWDRLDTPRQESFLIDERGATKAGGNPQAYYRHIRSAAESGWDFSSRWFADGHSLETVQTTQLLPVDLNCLLYHLETTLARARELSGDRAKASRMRAMAEKRRAAILRLCWSDAEGFFCDYDLGNQTASPALSLAGVAPLFFHIATQEQADAVARTLRERFLRPGGVVTTLASTGQQWDAPNGWAPLQWMTVQGLRNYGHGELAEEIARRWLKLNREVYARTGRLMEKYNVEDLSLAAGGGEYDAQDGFGWTNGVHLALAKQYPEQQKAADPKDAAASK
jgi:alpha,alpha-trehalase